MGRSYCVALVGLNGYIVEVEADIGQTLPNFVILGLPDAALNEAKERIRSAAQNSGIPLSRRKITANLIPASLPKRGSGFDLAITMAVLRAAEDIRSIDGTVFIAELGLDGRLRPVRGMLPAVMAAVQAGYPDIVVAEANVAEAALVPGANVRGYKTLARLAYDFGADRRTSPWTTIPWTRMSRRLTPLKCRWRRTFATFRGRKKPGKRWKSLLPADTICC